MITYHIGDATNPVGPPAEKKLILHVCNDYGGWGRGFVLALSSRWSQPERTYRNAKRLVLGKIQIVPVTPEICVINMIAQHGDSMPNKPAIHYDALEQCMLRVIESNKAYLASYHMPRIGCGLGGGDWKRVENLIYGTFPPHANVNVYDLHRP